MATSKNLVLRTVYISPELDDELRVEAFNSHTSKNDLIRKYLVMGMQRAADNETKTLAVKRAAPIKGKRDPKSVVVPHERQSEARVKKIVSPKTSMKKASVKKASSGKMAQLD